jgi:hypothetical protein
MAYQRKDPKDRIGHPHAAAGADQSGPVSRARSRRAGIPIPTEDPQWRPEVQSWFRSLKLSGQSEMYEASDWATAVAAAQAYHIFLTTHNASIFGQFVRLSERLGVTIGDRQRARIELTDVEASDADEEAADEAIASWQQRLRVVQ